MDDSDYRPRQGGGEQGHERGANDRPSETRWSHYAVIPRYLDGDPRSGERIDPNGLPGLYEVTLTTYRPGDRLFTQDVRYADAEAGDSFLQIVAEGGEEGPLVIQQAEGQTAHIELVPNRAGRLSLVRITVRADDFSQAREGAFRWATPVLSDFSFRYDAPLDIRKIDAKELRTGIIHMLAMTPGTTRVMAYPTPVVTLAPEIRAATSFYREGLAAINPAYQVLAFYKGVEGLRAARPRIAKRCKAQGVDPARPEERIPDGLVRGSDLQDLAGKSFEQAADRLRDAYRHAVAHFDMRPDQFDKLPDDLAFRFRCLGAAVVLRHMLRVMIEHDADLLARVGAQDVAGA